MIAASANWLARTERVASLVTRHVLPVLNSTTATLPDSSTPEKRVPSGDGLPIISHVGRRTSRRLAAGPMIACAAPFSGGGTRRPGRLHRTPAHTIAVAMTARLAAAMAIDFQRD